MKGERRRPLKYFGDELQAFLEEHDAHMHKQIEQQLNVDQSTVTKRLEAMGKILKLDSWVPHELTERHKENRKSTCEILLNWFGRKFFLHGIVIANENEYTLRTPSKKYRMWTAAKGQNILHGQMALERRQCSVLFLGSSWFI